MARPLRFLFNALLLCLCVVPLAAAQGSPGLPAWGTELAPNVGGLLNAISVDAHNDIWAVGHTGLYTNVDSLAMHFDGTAWTAVPTPDLEFGVRLQDVVAIAPNDAWAVGWSRSGQTLDDVSVAMHWDGTAWTIVPTPQPGGAYVDRLLAVDAVGPNDVWATGVYDDPRTADHSLILHWNGTEWKTVPRGRPVLHKDARVECDTYGGLSGITVSSATGIWAVGDSTTCHYDGSIWREIPSPQPRPEYDEIGYPLEDVSAASPTDVWAVGARIIDTPYQVVWDTLAEHWDGQRWTRFTIAIPVGQILLGVDAVASNDVWAVGADNYGPFIIHYDGATWSTVATPEARRGGRLSGVDSAAPNDLWASGYTQFGNIIEHAPSSTQGAVVGDTNVAQATISWFGPENGSTETNVYGEYEIGGLDAGSYTFTATNPGCTPDSETVVVVAGQTLQRDFHINCGPPSVHGRMK